jgi:hypothetical protein
VQRADYSFGHLRRRKRPRRIVHQDELDRRTHNLKCSQYRILSSCTARDDFHGHSATRNLVANKADVFGGGSHHDFIDER